MSLVSTDDLGQTRHPFGSKLCDTSARGIKVTTNKNKDLRVITEELVHVLLNMSEEAEVIFLAAIRRMINCTDQDH